MAINPRPTAERLDIFSLSQQISLTTPIHRCIFIARKLSHPHRRTSLDEFGRSEFRLFICHLLRQLNRLSICFPTQKNLPKAVGGHRKSRNMKTNDILEFPISHVFRVRWVGQYTYQGFSSSNISKTKRKGCKELRRFHYSTPKNICISGGEINLMITRSFLV